MWVQGTHREVELPGDDERRESPRTWRRSCRIWRGRTGGVQVPGDGEGHERLKDNENNVETDSINMEKYSKELSKVCWDMFRTTGAMLEQEQLRFINLFAATGNEGNARGHRVNKGIMEHKVINNLRCVSGDKSLFRLWHQRFVTALGQYDQVHEEIVQHLVKETDFGKDLDKVVEELKTMRGGDHARFGRCLERFLGQSGE